MLVFISIAKLCDSWIFFVGDGQFMALAERRDFSDVLSIFTVKNWSLTSHFQVNTTDLQGIRWAPDSVTLAVFEVGHQNLKICNLIRQLYNHTTIVVSDLYRSEAALLLHFGSSTVIY